MKDTLLFFSHDNNARNHPKMKALIAEFGYEGYGRFWALNERIAETSGACIDISKKVNKLDLAKELNLDGVGLDRFIAFLSDPEIDLINLIDNKISTDRINELYTGVMKNREDERVKKQQKKGKQEIPEGKDDFPEGKQEIPEGNDNKGTIGTIEKVNKGNINNSNELPPSKKIDLLDREPKNDIERVNKKWLENYIAIFKNQPINPAWKITTPLVSKILKQVGLEKVLQALDIAMEDEFCLKAGYMLKIIMSSNVISKLINKPSDFDKKINPYIPDADQSEQLLKEYAEYRKNTTNMSLTEAYKKVIRSKGDNYG